MKRYLAVDMGAESGRAMLGSLDGGTLAIEELHRFPNTPVRIRGSLYWDALRLYHEMQEGLAIGVRRGTLSGIAVDTWGVDFALLDGDGALIDNPRHYRDTRTHGMMDAVFARVPRDEVFAATGVQFMQLNSLYQWYAMAGSQALERARTLLFMPDLFNYWLTGTARAERTIASTSQFYDPRTRGWASGLIERLGLPASILPEIVEPGVQLGDAGGVPVYTTGCHDTASAVAAVPAGTDEWCYISSGTWSLMGVETGEPVITARSLAMNLTNEAGAGGKIRLLKNIAGLWLVQECRRDWNAAGHDYSYEQLAGLAAQARPFVAILDPDAFLEPGRMPARIEEYCARTRQSAPQTPGEFIRTILESLALRYRRVLEMLEELLGRRIATIHIVGGGSRNDVLNQFAADATGRRVIAGPAEATAIGNVLIQAIGAGDLGGLDDARALVRDSFPVRLFEPRQSWDAAYERYRALEGR